MRELQPKIERLFAQAPVEDQAEAYRVFSDFRAALTKGAIRAASPPNDENGLWTANRWVKQGILLGFRLGEMVEMGDERVLAFVDKDTFPPRHFRVDDGVRVVPGGSSVRSGAYVAKSVVCMPPMYINVGAYVDEGTMVDSNALVGSCAQVGKRVHISAGAQIGGVLEPVNASPVVLEDDVLVGGNCGIYEGAQVRKGAILGAGVVLTRSTPIFDIARNAVYRAEGDKPLIVPPGAVVVPGARAIQKGSAKDRLSLYTPVIVKYRDDKTETSVLLEELLR